MEPGVGESSAALEEWLEQGIEWLANMGTTPDEDWLSWVRWLGALQEELEGAETYMIREVKRNTYRC